jgi:CheY-like chemotaxis protein
MHDKNILIIDDDLPFSEMLSEILTDEGAKVFVAQDGTEGVALANQIHPHLITCDVMMPRMPGVEVLRAIRSTEWGSKVPFVFLTNMNQPEMPDDLVSDTQGHIECLLKTDWTLDALSEKIKEVVAKYA